MRNILVVGILFFGAGCQNVVGPFRGDATRADDPCYTIAEQQRRARATLALPEQSPWVVPPGQTRPDVWGNQGH
jgi:hypothetical protein